MAMNYAQPMEMSLVCLLDCSMVQKTASTAIHNLVCPDYVSETNNIVQ